MTRRTIFLNDSIWNRLKKLAAERGEKISVIVRVALYEFLIREEK